MSAGSIVEYSENQDFNGEFDLDNSEITIGALPAYKASYVLYCVDYEAYLEAIEEYEERKDEYAQSLILSEYPQPISYYFHQSQKGYSNNNHRLQLLRSTWEAVIFTLYALVIGEARKNSFPLRSIAVPRSDGNPDLSFSDYFSDRLAQKLQIIERVLIFCRDNSVPLSCSNIIPLPVLQRIRELNQARNGFMHTAALSESQASLRYSELYPDVLGVLKDLEQLSSVHLLRFITVGDSPTNVRFEVFQGYNLARDTETFEISPSQLLAIASELNAHNILIKYQDDIFSISPFFHFSEDANGNRTNLCYCKRRISASRYEYEIVTHSQSYEIDGAVFADRIDELRELII
jgi:hypothetical protein